VTVRAEHPKIFQPVIVANAVDVVDLDGQRSAPPFAQAAPIATVYDYTSPEQVALYR
jgi:ribosomal protein L32E